MTNLTTEKREHKTENLYFGRKYNMNASNILRKSKYAIRKYCH